jgi:hypothetical protein
MRTGVNAARENGRHSTPSERRSPTRQSCAPRRKTRENGERKRQSCPRSRAVHRKVAAETTPLTRAELPLGRAVARRRRRTRRGRQPRTHRPLSNSRHLGPSRPCNPLRAIVGARLRREAPRNSARRTEGAVQDDPQDRQTVTAQHDRHARGAGGHHDCLAGTPAPAAAHVLGPRHPLRDGAQNVARNTSIRTRAASRSGRSTGGRKHCQ